MKDLLYTFRKHIQNLLICSKNNLHLADTVALMEVASTISPLLLTSEQLYSLSSHICYSVVSSYLLIPLLPLLPPL